MGGALPPFCYYIYYFSKFSLKIQQKELLEMSPNVVIAIDPGAKGGIAVKGVDGTVETHPMPDGMTQTVDLLRSIVAVHRRHNVEMTGIMEKVGSHREGNNAQSSCTFARHCGQLEAALYCLGVPVEQILPTMWMKHLGAMPKEKKERKNRIKELMQRKFPHIKVTLSTSDALGILCFATRGGR